MRVQSASRTSRPLKLRENWKSGAEQERCGDADEKGDANPRRRMAGVQRIDRRPDRRRTSAAEAVLARKEMPAHRRDRRGALAVRRPLARKRTTIAPPGRSGQLTTRGSSPGKADVAVARTAFQAARATSGAASGRAGAERSPSAPASSP